MLTALALLLGLIMLNGVFAMSEIAIVSSRRARLEEAAGRGDARAGRALALASEPTRFLSTVQVGITSIGILSGAIGEASLVDPISAAIAQAPGLEPYAPTAALALMVVGLTYVSLVIGELVPKRLALTRPERIAGLIARPMELVAIVARPLVHLLTVSTDTLLRVMRVRTVKGPAVTIEELRLLVAQGTAEGVFEKTEQELMTNVLKLDERSAAAHLTPRSEILYVDLQQPFDRTREKLSRDSHSILPLCDGGLEHVVGVVRSTDVLKRFFGGEPIDFRQLASPPLFVPQTVTLMHLLEQFRRTHLPVALVIDEFGDIAGLVSLADVMAAIVGELPEEPGEEPDVVRRADGSWLIDGGLDIESLERTLGAKTLAGEERQYHTLAGLAMLELRRVPKIGDVFEREGFRFEIVDMDGNRVDRVLVHPVRRQTT